MDLIVGDGERKGASSACPFFRISFQLGYSVTRQTGSHLRLTTHEHGEHHLKEQPYLPVTWGESESSSNLGDILKFFFLLFGGALAGCHGQFVALFGLFCRGIEGSTPLVRVSDIFFSLNLASLCAMIASFFYSSLLTSPSRCLCLPSRLSYTEFHVLHRSLLLAILFPSSRSLWP